MTSLRSLAFLALTLTHASFAQEATSVPSPACTGFLGHWSGTWSQGFYGKQRIHVTHVSDDCVATLAYSPTEAAPTATHQLQIKEGIIAFPCNIQGGVCRMEVLGDELKFTYREPSGFVNQGTFRRGP
jgi:hypothetical protein